MKEPVWGWNIPVHRLFVFRELFNFKFIVYEKDKPLCCVSGVVLIRM